MGAGNSGGILGIPFGGFWRLARGVRPGTEVEGQGGREGSREAGGIGPKVGPEVGPDRGQQPVEGEQVKACIEQHQDQRIELAGAESESAEQQEAGTCRGGIQVKEEGDFGRPGPGVVAVGLGLLPARAGTEASKEAETEGHWEKVDANLHGEGFGVAALFPGSLGNLGRLGLRLASRIG